MNKIFQLDQIDRNILRILQRKGDISQSALAEDVGASPSSCWRRIKAMEEGGVLGPVVQLLNPAALGRTLDAVCHVRMKGHDSENRSQFERFVQVREEVLECLSISGDWDYQLRIVVSDMAEYEDFLMRTLLSHPSVLTSSSHFAIKRVKYTTAMKI